MTGGADGAISVWHIFSGAPKGKMEMPEVKWLPVDKPKKKGNMFGALAALKDKHPAIRVATEGDVIRKSIVSIIFHPHYENIVFALLEGGQVHGFDSSVGSLVNDNLAQVRINSNWAIDPFNMSIFIVGDTGKATLYDCAMGAWNAHAVITGAQRRPGFVKIPNHRWPIKRKEFITHPIGKTSNEYVNCVKFLPKECMFATGTCLGKVKLWSAL